MKSKWIKGIIAGVVAIGISLGVYFGYNTVFAKKATAASVQYITATAKTMNLQVNVQGTGAAYAATTKEVMPNNNGTLENLTVKVGDTVTAGQKLFTCSSDELQTAVANAQNSLTEANIGLSSSEKDLIAKQNALSKAQAATTTTSDGDQSNSQGSKSIDDYKLEVEKAKLAVEQSKVKVTNAKSNLANAKANVTKMSVIAPIGGVIVAVNNSNGDSIQKAQSGQSSQSVLTVVDMNSTKIKVSVDELDIEKIKLGQKTQIKFEAINDKTYEGIVETIAQIGTTENNVTKYDVVVGITKPEGIKLGMNANVTIQVENKENALVIPAEALVESNGKKFVRVESTDSNASSSNMKTNNSTENNTEASSESSQGQNKNWQGTNSEKGARNAQAGSNRQNTTSSGRLVEIKTGLENENYIEVVEGLTEGQKVLITLPKTNSTSTSSNGNNRMSGFGEGMPGGGGSPSGERKSTGGVEKN